MNQPRLLKLSTNFGDEYVFIDSILTIKHADAKSNYRTVLNLKTGHKVYALEDVPTILEFLRQHGAIIL